MPTLDGQRAIVTGGAAGLGRAICLRLAAEGATVGVLDRRADRAAAVAEQVGGVSREVDVSDGRALRDTLGDAAAEMGGLDLLVNNAGVGWMAPLSETPQDKWERVLAVNLTGTMNGIKAAIPLMSKRGGAIVNVASISAVRPSAGEAPYAASKAGVVALTASAALELGPEIRVNSISPGPVDTPLLKPLFDAHPEERRRYVDSTPLGRIATPDDIGDAVVLLASPLARFITGQNLVVDGGITLHGSSVDGMLELVTGDGLSMKADYSKETVN